MKIPSSTVLRAKTFFICIFSISGINGFAPVAITNTSYLSLNSSANDDDEEGKDLIDIFDAKTEDVYNEFFYEFFINIYFIT